MELFIIKQTLQSLLPEGQLIYTHAHLCFGCPYCIFADEENKIVISILSSFEHELSKKHFDTFFNGVYTKEQILQNTKLWCQLSNYLYFELPILDTEEEIIDFVKKELDNGTNST